MADSAWEIIQGLYLICSVLHIFVVSLGHLIAMTYIIGHKPKRLLSLLVFTCILFVICAFFWHAFAYLSLANLFNGGRWPPDLFRTWPVFFVIDPILLILVIWFKLACSIDAFRFLPTRAEVERFRDDYEAVKGHRDFIVIYCLRGDEPQDESLTSIRAAINSNFPTHRLRLLLLFYGVSSSELHQFLRTHISTEPLDPSLEDVPMENLVASNGVKISILRMSSSSSQKAKLRCLDFLTMAYEEDKLRKPIVCFLSSTIALDEMAIASFVYELDDPHREFITGMLLQSDTEFTSSRLLCSMSFWTQVQTRIAQDYCGNMTYIQNDFLVARFKALKAIAAQVFSESDASESMQNHQLSLALIKAKSARHRLGLCLGALGKPIFNLAPQSFVKTLTEHAESSIDGFLYNADLILESHIWQTTPLLGLLVVGTSILEPHIFFFMQLFLLERASGRGSALASSYIFLLLIPSYLFSAFAGSRYGDKFAFIAILVNFLLKPLIDTIADIVICILFFKNVWDRKSRTSVDAKATSELTAAQKIV